MTSLELAFSIVTVLGLTITILLLLPKVIGEVNIRSFIFQMTVFLILFLFSDLIEILSNSFPFTDLLGIWVDVMHTVSIAFIATVLTFRFKDFVRR